jgi:hypothetical protein
MNTNEVTQYLTNNALKLLQEEAHGLAEKHETLLHTREITDLEKEKASFGDTGKRLQKEIDQEIQDLKDQADRVDPEEIRQIRTEINRIEKLTREIEKTSKKPDLLLAESYVFNDEMIVQVGHTEFSLVDYGKVDDQTGQLLVYGSIHELPEPIDIGRKVHFSLFDPWDTRTVEDGGMIKTIGLTVDDRMALYQWTERAGRYMSVLSQIQQLITVKKQRDGLTELVKDLQTDAGEYVRQIRALQKQVVDQGGGMLNFASILLSMSLSILGLMAFGFILGSLLSLSLPASIVERPFYNATRIIRIDQIQTPNPLATSLPSIMIFCFAFIGILFASRRWGRRAT